MYLCAEARITTLSRSKVKKRGDSNRTPCITHYFLHAVYYFDTQRFRLRLLRTRLSGSKSRSNSPTSDTIPLIDSKIYPNYICYTLL